MSVNPLRSVKGAVDDAPTPCQLRGPALWFSERPSDLELAKAFCRGCPIQQACFIGAYRRREPHGVWGGEIFDGGMVVPHKRGRGRPPKHAKTAAAG
jgi:WhiB family transcriptional regulator, redox-sensing transcriptional regulator